jgi:predicted acylesterase/phospholipase RssA
MLPLPPLRIVLSGGGIRGLSYVGVFLELEKRKLLKHVKEILGVSCGAFFGFAYSIGYTPKEMLEFVENFNFSLVQNIEPDIAFDFLSQFGIDDKTQLKKLLFSLLKNKGFHIYSTFQDLYNKTKFTLRCYASNLNRCTFDEFSYELTPNVVVVEALLASMCIPGYFLPCIINNHMYVDGALINNFPIDLVPIKDLKDTFGFTFSEDHTNVETIQTIEYFFYQIYACLFIPYKKKILKSINHRIIIIQCGTYPMWNFDSSKEQRQDLIQLGIEAVQNYFSFNMFTLKENIKRRYSVG